MMRTQNWMAAVGLLMLISCGLQAAPEGAVTGTGRAVITRQPELLRMQMVITAEGKDIADATSKLKEAKAAAAKSLEGLGAADKSIDFGPTQVGTGENPQQQYMQRMVSMRNRGGKPPEKPKTVTVSSTLKAEWPLKAGSPDELLVLGYGLQEKVKATGLTKKETKQLSPEEQEALEEAQAMQAASGAPGGAPGEPTFQYVCKVPDADQVSAIAEAFKKAKSDAANLAKATGGELGALIHVSSVISSPSPGEDESNAYARLMMRQMTGEAAPGPTPTGEAVSNQAGPLELQVSVTASFALK
ncbi:MAG TPA: SIMPL domain-containing protein [Humisphaera sp.]|jgi:uncharacterized protein YggE|nr:SIMPL domain-containing protein [Humisphaera sp.]